MSKLGKKLFLVFLILITLSLFLVGIFINFSIGERFNSFINLQREEQISELADVLEENLKSQSFNNLRHLIENFSRTNSTPIWVKDNQGNFIYSPLENTHMSQMMRRMGMHKNSHMGNSHMGMMRQLPSDFPGISRTTNIYIDNEKKLTLYWKEVNTDNQINSKLYNYFKTNVYRAIILSALLVIFFIFILSFILSKKITKPLINLKNAALEVAGGNYEQEIKTQGDDELTELINSFNLMTKKLLKLEKIRKESTSDLAHELRTPLTTIKGYLEAIEDGKMQADKITVKEMQEEAARMTTLVEKLNEFADAQNKVFKLNKRKLDIIPLLKKVIKQQQHFLDNKNITLDLNIHQELKIEADKDSLVQIFNNIIENAVKYNVVGGQINIKTIKSNKQVIIEIKDNGIGINESDLPYIFERFYRADKSRNSKNQGSGIGLAVVKELMEANLGEIKVKSDEKATLFKLIFPSLN